LAPIGLGIRAATIVQAPRARERLRTQADEKHARTEWGSRSAHLVVSSRASNAKKGCAETKVARPISRGSSRSLSPAAGGLALARSITMTLTLRPAQRLLHTARPRHARLIGSHLSVSPDFANAPPPPVPTVAQTTAPRQLRPIDRQGQHAQPTETKTAPQARAPEAARPTSRTDDGDRLRTTTQGSPKGGDRGGKFDTAESAQDCVSAAALEAHLLRTLAQLHEKRRLGAEVGLGTEDASASEATSSTAAWLDLPTLARQKRDREGHVVEDLTVEYEPTPGASRRLRLDGRTGVQQQDGPETIPVGHDAAEEQDGIVTVAHVLGGENPRVSICSGFAVGKPDHAASAAGDGQVILTCAHTLDSASPR
jgi:hypothetical protein